MKLPQGVTWISLLLALVAWLVDPKNAPLITGALGEHAALYIIAAASLLAGFGRSVLGSNRKLPKGVTAAGMLIALATLLADSMYGPQLATLFGQKAAISLASFGALLAGIGAAFGGVTAPPPPDSGTT